VVAEAGSSKAAELVSAAARDAVDHNGVRVGATDERQAAEIANLIRLELGATIIESRPFTRLGRWSFHHQVVGGYAKE
jgi:hypothetical protein